MYLVDLRWYKWSCLVSLTVGMPAVTEPVNYWRLHRRAVLN
jgi:hypothetical protein